MRTQTLHISVVASAITKELKMETVDLKYNEHVGGARVQV